VSRKKKMADLTQLDHAAAEPGHERGGTERKPAREHHERAV
jgi:hypothetical protein